MNKSPEIDRRQFLKFTAAGLATLLGLDAIPVLAQEQIPTPNPTPEFIESPYAPTPVVNGLYEIASLYGVDTSTNPGLLKIEFSQAIPLFALGSVYAGGWYDTGATLPAGSHLYVVSSNDLPFDYHDETYMRLPHEENRAVRLTENGLPIAGITMTGMLASSPRI